MVWSLDSECSSHATSLQQEYWRILENIDEDVMVEYGADLHTMDHGSGFPTLTSKNLSKEDEIYAKVRIYATRCCKDCWFSNCFVLIEKFKCPRSSNRWFSWSRQFKAGEDYQDIISVLVFLTFFPSVLKPVHLLNFLPPLFMTGVILHGLWWWHIGSSRFLFDPVVLGVPSLTAVRNSDVTVLVLKKELDGEL